MLPGRDLFRFQNNSPKFQACRRMGPTIDPSQVKGLEEHELQINRRRYPRYEIDTPLHMTLLGVEQRGTMHGRSLDINEAGIAGVFVTEWEVGIPVQLEFSVPVTSR